MTQVEANTNSGKQKTRKNEKLNTPFEYKTLKIQFYSQIVKMKKTCKILLAYLEYLNATLLLISFICLSDVFEHINQSRWCVGEEMTKTVCLSEAIKSVNWTRKKIKSEKERKTNKYCWHYKIM